VEELTTSDLSNMNGLLESDEAECEDMKRTQETEGKEWNEKRQKMTPTLVTQDRRVFYKKMEEEQGETGDEKNSKKQLEILRQAGNKRA
jgi:hypothetical protein